MRRAGKRDGNHRAIVDGLRAAGCSVADLGSAGEGIPDLLVGFRGRNLLLEIKDGSLPPSARELTPKQVKFHAAWRGQRAIVLSLAEALEAVWLRG